MIEPARKIDQRTDADVARRVAELLVTFTRRASGAPFPAFHPWDEYDPKAPPPPGASAALIGTFARFGDILIQRLNQALDKNFAAFLELLGAARLPPEPARVALTFSLAAGAERAKVPAGTKVGAVARAGDTQPIVFEVERGIELTAVQLATLLTLDPEQDTYGDWSAPDLGSPFPVFQGERSVEHVLYIGDKRLLGYTNIHALRAIVDCQSDLAAPDPRVLAWERWDGGGWVPLIPSADSTTALTRSGQVEFVGATPAVPPSVVGNQTSRWLRCRLLTPITRVPLATARAGVARAESFALIQRVQLAVGLERKATEGLAPDRAFANSAPLDITKEFLPFGEKPKLYDTFFLASQEAFSKDLRGNAAPESAAITLAVDVANPAIGSTPDRARPSEDLQLVWECANGDNWVELGRSGAPAWLPLLELDAYPTLTGDPATATARLSGKVRNDTALSWVNLPTRDGTQVSESPIGVSIGGRFGVNVPLNGMSDNLNVIEFRASQPRRSVKAWAIVVRGVLAQNRVVLTASTSSAITTQPVTTVTVRISGPAQTVTVIITNGASSKAIAQQTVLVTAQPIDLSFQVELTPGQNPLLIEARSASQDRVAATTTGVACFGTLDSKSAFSDGTFGLTQSGEIKFRLPAAAASARVNGQDNHWVRVRLVRGNYGSDSSYVLKDPAKPEDGFTLIPAAFQPPVVAAVRIGYTFTDQRSPEFCLGCDQLQFTDRTAAARGEAPFSPFSAASDLERPALYLGFLPPKPGAPLPNAPLALYASLAETPHGARGVPLSQALSVKVGSPGTRVKHAFVLTNAAVKPQAFSVVVFGSRWTASAVGLTLDGLEARALDVEVAIPDGAEPGDSDRAFLCVRGDQEAPATVHTASLLTAVSFVASDPPKLAWEYWNGRDWAKLALRDDSNGFSRPGLLEFIAPADFAKVMRFGRECHWVRAVYDAGEYSTPPRLRHLLANTTLAAHSPTVVGEVLGSSNGDENQRFVSTRAPVFAGQVLEIREPELPSGAEKEELRKDHAEDALRIVEDVAGRPREIWVRWREMPDFYASGPRDRHYVVDHLRGEFHFGNGVNGRIPPIGSRNIVLARYRTGGGTAGNRPIGAVKELKTTIPYVEKVTNLEPAVGGAEAEPLASVYDRVPRSLRHRDRAVTLEDYADLACRASPEVARALTVPLRDLESDALAEVPRPGFVSVIIVPNTTDKRPLPTLELIERVERFLAERIPAGVGLSLVGPLYLRVDVRADIAVRSPEDASGVETAVVNGLDEFLHPLSGGLDGTGWGFGRAPHRSDFMALIEAIPGVDHVRFLELVQTEEIPGARQTGRFLVHSGQHRIALTFDDT